MRESLLITTLPEQVVAKALKLHGLIPNPVGSKRKSVWFDPTTGRYASIPAHKGRVGPDGQRLICRALGLSEETFLRLVKAAQQKP